MYVCLTGVVSLVIMDIAVLRGGASFLTLQCFSLLIVTIKDSLGSLISVQSLQCLFLDAHFLWDSKEAPLCKSKYEAKAEGPTMAPLDWMGAMLCVCPLTCTAGRCFMLHEYNSVFVANRLPYRSA